MPEICSDVDPENKLCQGEDEDRNNHDYDDDQLIMIIIKQSLPSSRQVQLATRLTAWSVAQVQLRPAQGGVGQNITWNIVLLEYYCTGILQKKLN